MVGKGFTQTLLKSHYEKMAELERLEKRMAELLRELQDNLENLEHLGALKGRPKKNEPTSGQSLNTS